MARTLLAVVLMMTSAGVRGQKPAPEPKPTEGFSLPDGTTITVNPNNGEIVVQLPKTDTTATVNTKDGETTAKDNQTQQPLPKNPSPKPPAGNPAKPPKPAGGIGGNGGKGGGSVVATPNPDGSITVTVTNGGQTETFTVKPETNPQTGQTTTTVTTPSDPQASASVTNDKNGNTTGAKANAGGGQGFVVVPTGTPGVSQINYVDANGNVTSGPTYDNETQTVDWVNGIPHVRAKTPAEIAADKKKKAAEEKKKAEAEAGAAGTEGTGNEAGSGTTPGPTPPATPPATPPSGSSHHGGRQATGTGNPPNPPSETPNPASGGSSMNAPQALPPGAIFCSAPVTSGQSIQAQQPGYAVLASAGVQSVKRVNPGDILSVSNLVSMVFDTGVGMIINHLTQPAAQPAPPVTATVGSTPIAGSDQTSPLPVNGGKATVYVASSQPFETPAIATDTVTRTPDKTYATVLNSSGEKVGQLDDYVSLPANSSSWTIKTEDANGATLEQASVAGGELDGTPTAVFNKPSYKAGESGVLELGNFDNYQKMAALTRFGGADNLTKEPIRLIPISDVSGMPAQVPYGTAKVPFVAGSPGEAEVAVYFPQAVPPQPVANPGNSDLMKQADTQFEDWKDEFGATAGAGTTESVPSP
ncbi:MAG: hypothetical protein WB341_15000 [Terracidiphilus sp.]